MPPKTKEVKPIRRYQPPRFYRRHSRTCPHFRSDQKRQDCECPVWVRGIVCGRYIVRTTGTSSFLRAKEVVGEMYGIDEIAVARAIIAAHERCASDGVVYLVQRARDVKIGWATDPKPRIANLQTASPTKLKTLVTMGGGRELERELHEIFHADHKRGEWFRFSPTILAFTTRVRRLIGVRTRAEHEAILPAADVCLDALFGDDILQLDETQSCPGFTPGC